MTHVMAWVDWRSYMMAAVFHDPIDWKKVLRSNALKCRK